MSKSNKLTLENVDQSPSENDTQVEVQEGDSVISAVTDVQPQDQVEIKDTPMSEEQNKAATPATTDSKPAVDPRTAAAAKYQSDREKTLARLRAEPTVQMMIPLRNGETEGSTHEVGYNGVVLVYPKNELIAVPHSIFLILSEHFKITNSVGKELRLDRGKDVQTALQ